MRYTKTGCRSSYNFSADWLVIQADILVPARDPAQPCRSDRSFAITGPSPDRETVETPVVTQGGRRSRPPPLTRDSHTPSRRYHVTSSIILDRCRALHAVIFDRRNGIFLDSTSNELRSTSSAPMRGLACSNTHPARSRRSGQAMPPHRVQPVADHSNGREQVGGRHLPVAIVTGIA